MIRYFAAASLAALLLALPVRTAEAGNATTIGAPGAYNWTGFYIGGHLGGGWQNADFSDPGALSILDSCCFYIGDTNGPVTANSATAGTFLGGAQAGWMYQIGQLVAGVDFNFSATHLSVGGSDTSAVGGLSESFSANTDWTTTATATLGIAHGRWLVYGKAGAAIADQFYNLGITGPGFTFTSGGDRQIIAGWTTGFGVKWGISDNWFINAEYDFLDFGTHVAHVSGTLSATPVGFGMTSAAASFEPQFNWTISEVKVGLNYKFGSAGSTGSAAADMSRPPRQSYDWSGLYVGGHLGGGWQNLAIADASAFSILSNCCLLLGDHNDPSAISGGTSGSFLGGAQAGWMYQIGRLVAGMEVDFTKTNINGHGSSMMTPGGAGYYAHDNYSASTNWTATATANIGIANGRWMVYTKAGAAWADNTYSVNINGAGANFGAPIPFSFAASSTQIVPGWTIGLGVNWALSNDWFLNAEYDYLDFGTQVAHVSGSFSATPGVLSAIPSMSPSATFDPTFSQSISEVKIGLNYKPSGNSGPLFAPDNPSRDYDWSGFYVGGQIGGDWADVAFSDPGGYSTLNNCCILLSHTNNPSTADDATGGNFLGGIQAGWMYQLHRIVVGGDFDFSGTTLKASGSETYSAIPTVGDFVHENYTVHTDWIATSTAVLGFARDSWMVYGKAGAAMAGNRYSLSISGAGGNYGPGGATPFSFATSTSDIIYGWTIGAGLKWALSDHWFVNAEYDFLDFDAKTENLSGVFTAAPQWPTLTAATFHPTFDPTISEVKFGVNYKFSPSLNF